MSEKPRRCPLCNHELQRPGRCPYCGSDPSGVGSNPGEQVHEVQPVDRVGPAVHFFWKGVLAVYLALLLTSLVGQGSDTLPGWLRLQRVVDWGCVLVSLYVLSGTVVWIRQSLASPKAKRLRR